MAAHSWLRSGALSSRLSWRNPELLAALVVSVAFVAARSLVYVLYEHAFFDSDRAIIGLMAKHLAEGRAFPLFFYGQAYMLGTEAWFAAPFFLVGGPTVASLHVSQVVLNAAAAVLFVCGLVAWGGLRPALAATAVAFFSFVPPLTGAYLLEAGSNVPPFVFIGLLWLVRHRPVVFGVLLAVGFLTREFAIYGAAAIGIGEALAGALWSRERITHWLVVAVVALATWQTVQALKPYADLMGPGTRGQLLNGLGGSQVGNLRERSRLPVDDLGERLSGMASRHVPQLLGASRVERAIATQGHDWLYLPAALILAGGVIRGGLRGWRGSFVPAAYGWYLLGVGLLAILASVLTRPDEAVADRYILLVVLLPVGAAAIGLAGESNRAWKAALIGLAGVWLGASAIDHVNQAARYAGGREPNDMRLLVDALEARGIEVAESTYWRAYKATFMSQERVIVAPTDFTRVQVYQQRRLDAGGSIVRVQETPCAAGQREERVGIWFLCRS